VYRHSRRRGWGYSEGETHVTGPTPKGERNAGAGTAARARDTTKCMGGGGGQGRSGHGTCYTHRIGPPYSFSTAWKPVSPPRRACIGASARSEAEARG
jgi:hypothetical protein